MSDRTALLRILVICLALVAGLTVVPGVAVAESGVSGTIVVESDETVSSISAIAGTIVVEGTVTGDVSGLAGDVVVEDGGTVEGDLSVAAGNVRIAGTVEGDVSTGSGTLHVTETGSVGGDLNAGAADVRFEGTIHGDVRVGADTIFLGDEAEIRGSLTYDGDLSGNTDAVAGDITRDRSLAPDLASDVQPFVSWIFAINAFILNFLLGALLLLVAPRFSDQVGSRVATDPLRSGLVGFGLFIGIPLVLVLVALTIIGIPIMLGGLLLFLLLAWIGLVYGRFAIGRWLLSFTDVENRFVALFVGLLVAVVLAQIPFLGGLLNFFIFLLGLGALVTALVAHRRRMRTAPTETAGEPAPVE